MASFMTCRTVARASARYNVSRMLTTASQAPIASSSSSTSSSPSQSSPSSSQESSSTEAGAPITHFKITLRRSAISLGDKIKGTLKALGIHRRFQTVYFPHSPEVAGKILRVKELVEVENVPTHLVKTKQQQRQERKAPRGYKVVGSKRDSFMKV
ncbi:54S ribosomal protein L33, mitochondrial [Psilocybe cubensis]|uniref:Large ribosomal subunit protein uL30m n=2 Tax=Psilocybe cubensis TaxID=181762 RepID=A0A8H8CDZ5_PSICU|nr:54S ribosomal protein L33, mitochondrial [Psilocybe cubensis]KAH9481909.1 54S ribosomal protein L33, mitochondrial [Psilocybe cubensis]